MRLLLSGTKGWPVDTATVRQGDEVVGYVWPSLFEDGWMYRLPEWPHPLYTTGTKMDAVVALARNRYGIVT